MREEKSLNIRKKVKACMVALSLCSVVPLLFLITETYSHAKQEQEAMALYKKGVELGTLHYDEKAVDTYNELIRNFKDSKDPKIQQLVTQALYKKGVELGNLHYDKEAVDAYAELIRNFEDSKDPEIQQLVAQALYKKGIELGNLHCDEKARAAYNELITLFGSSKDPKIQQLVTQASHKKCLSIVGSYTYPILQQVSSSIPIDLVGVWRWLIKLML